MKPLTVAVAACLAAFALAGCAGQDDEPKAQATDLDDRPRTTSSPRNPARSSASATATAAPDGNTSGSGNATVPGNGTGNETGPDADGNETGNATGNATWQFDNRTGRIAGSGPPLLTSTHSVDHVITVANGTENLTVNVTATGRDMSVTIVPAGCEEEGCQTSIDVDDGASGQQAFPAPAEGNWTVTLSISGAGTIGADYVLGLAWLVAAQNATADP